LKDLINWIISDDQSFTIVENKFFQIMIKRLNKETNIPSADTITNRILKIFSNEQANLQKIFQEISSKISFTLDCWISKNQKSYLGITAH
ncbi:10562_t:CDS:1, partial [Scutellospora calospora]